MKLADTKNTNIPGSSLIELFGKGLEKHLFRKKYDYRQLLKTFADEVLTVLKLDELSEITVSKLSEIMKLDSASIMIHAEEKGDYRMIASTLPEVSDYALKIDEDMFKEVHKKRSYILFKDKEFKNFFAPDFGEKIELLRAELFIPLMHYKDMVGLLFLGRKTDGKTFTQEDMDILLPLVRALSIAISNALLFDKLSAHQAQAAQREKMAVVGTLSAGINHEICNPLGIVRGQCEMFLLNLEDGVYAGKKPEELLDQARGIMQKVIHETDRATSITKKLSAFAKPAKREMSKDVKIEKELDEVIALIEHDLKLDNIAIKKEIDKHLSCIEADSKQLQEIFFNIIKNAAQSIRGEGEILIRALSRDSKIYIDITDSGEGIGADDLKQIFHPFFTTKEPGKGTGLGLFITKQIVEKNNGRIAVKSQIGKGTTFSLIFNAA